MLRDSVPEQDHINVVVKVLFLLMRWFLLLHFAGQQERGYVPSASFSVEHA